MALGKASVTAVDTGSGGFTEPERQLIFIGTATKNKGTVQYIDQTTDLDEVLGADDSPLKTMVNLASLNAGTNWTCVAIALADGQTWPEAFNNAMDINIVCEGVVVCDALADQAAVNDLIIAVADAENEYARNLFIMGRCAPLGETETWSQFITRFDAMQDGIASDGVMLVPDVWDGWMGVLAGRLCHESQSIADTPMRTASGSIVGFVSLPEDADGVQYNMSHAKALNDARGSVPQTYADYDGIYCSDGMTLAAEGSDFAVIENLRVVNSVKRKVRILAIKKIGNRQLNSTAASIAAHETYFMRPMIDMSKSFILAGVPMPGDVKPPQAGDVTITWLTRTEVVIGILVRPYNCPKSIKAYVALNLTGA